MDYRPSTMDSKPSTKIDICYIVSHGFAARMVLQTGLLKRLRAEGKTVSLITPDANDANLKLACESEGITLHEFKNSQPRSGNYNRMRKYFLEDIKNNVALWEKYRVEKRFSWKRRLLAYFGITMYRLNKIFPIIRRRFKSYEQQFLDIPEAQDFIKKINPKLLVSTYPVGFEEGILLHAANQLNIQTCIHLLSWDNITCKGHFPVLADKYIAWGPVMASEFEEFYNIEKQNIYECGVPHFDLHFQIKNKPNIAPFIEELGLDASKPYLFFAMSSPRFAPLEIDIVEHLARQIEAGIFGENMQFIARPHPQNVVGSMADTTWLGRLDALVSKRVKIDYPQLVDSKLQWSMKQGDMIRLSNMLHGAACCVNSGSTVSIDSFMVDTPVVITAFDADEERDYWFSAKRVTDFPHMKKFLSFGGASISRSYDELTAHLKNYIENPKANWEARQYAQYMETAKNDGCATERVCEALLEILGDEKLAQKNENRTQIHTN